MRSAIVILLAAAAYRSSSITTAYTTPLRISQPTHRGEHAFRTKSRSRRAALFDKQRHSLSTTTSLNGSLSWHGVFHRRAGIPRSKKRNDTVAKIPLLFQNRFLHPLDRATQTIKRAIAILLVAVIVTLGSVPMTTQTSHANSGTTMTTTTARIVSSSRPTVQLASSTASSAPKAKLDKMIEKYVRSYMFSDDVFDPFESAYREAHFDQTGSAYPTIISETAADILGKKEVAAKAEREGSVLDKAWARLNNLADMLETRFGVNKQLSLSTMFIGIFCTPLVALFLGAIAFGERQKEKSEQMALERYGYGLNDLSAAEQIEEDIEAPDDDEEEDDDEDEDEDKD